VQSEWIVEPEEIEIGRQIGLGSVGAVFKGTIIASGKIVAVKVSKPNSPTPPFAAAQG
jgi:serine/threonine protein kinase